MSSAVEPSISSITPNPSDDEVAAIMAAIQVATQRSTEGDRTGVPRWRFSGRWWTRPAPMRRRRPWGV